MWNSEQLTQGQCRVLIVEKSRLAAEALMFALDSDPRINAIGYESDGWEAVETVSSYGPDVVLVGPEVDNLAPLQFTTLVHDFFPETTPIVICKRDRPEDVRDAQTAGAAHCLSTACSADELLHTITNARTPQHAQRTEDLEPHLRLAGAGAASA
jgi:DNA-binding NarL/FixJ family response regulator